MIIERKEYQDTDGTVGYVETVINSDNILKTTYFPKNQRLYIAFSRGHTYSYSNIDLEQYLKFEEADSQGKFFHKNINNNNKHPHRKEFTLYPNEVIDLKEIVENNKPEDKNDE